jgi:hypothetical protein
MFPLLIPTSWAEYPIPDITSVLAFAGTDKEYEPSVLVVVPILVPFTKTEAPVTGSPVASVTLPVIVRFCAIEDSRKQNIADNVTKSFLMCVFYFIIKKLEF